MKSIFGHSTKGLLDWKPDAQAELPQMQQMYIDLLGIENAVANNKCIIMGRKGAGKSAYATLLLSKSKDAQSTVFCEKIDPHEIQLEKLIEVTDDGGEQYGALLEWLILYKLVSLIIQTPEGKYNQNYNDLSKFYKDTSGHVMFSQHQIKETITTQTFNIAPILKINARAGLERKKQAYRADFYTMIGTLRTAVMETLRMPVYQNYRHYILIDDIDEEFSLKDQKAKDRLLALIRIVCNYNSLYLLNTSAKVLMFVRDDIADNLSGNDSAKLFGSYAHEIKWYNNEEDLLYELVNHRLKITLIEKGINFGECPWEFFARNGYNQFKQMLDYTFYLPRDIVNILRLTNTKNWTLPLSDEEFKTLYAEYAPTKIQELCNELNVQVGEEYIPQIKQFMYKVAKYIKINGHLTYDQVISILKDQNLPDECFVAFVAHDILVPVNELGRHYFSYREHQFYGDYKDYKYALPKILYEHMNQQ